MELAIETNDLTKIYKDKKAIEGITLQLPRGEIYGLIGRNGAGKTTLMKVLSGQVRQSRGTFRIFGGEKEDALRMGTLVEAPGLYLDMSAMENLRLKAAIFGIRRKGHLESLLDLVDLQSVAGKKVRKFSLGMKQRLGIALALLGEPDLLMLDEPINGMDPQGIADFRQIMLRLREEKGMTIVISSHILEELAKFATSFGIIDEGRLVKEIDRDGLAAVSRSRMEIRSGNIAKVSALLQEKLGFTQLEAVEETLLHVYEGIDDPGRVNRVLVEGGIIVDTLSVGQQSLEQFFVETTGGGKYA